MRTTQQWMTLAVVAVAIAGCGGESGVLDGGALDAGALDAGAVGSDASGPADASADAALDAGGGGWRTEPPLPEPIQEITGAVHEGRLWIAGGFDDSTAVTRAVRIFDPESGEWSSGPDLPAPRHHAMLVSTGEDLFLLGGMQTLAFEPLDTAWVLRSGATAWTPISSLPEDRGAGFAAAVGDRIVIAGGNGRGGLATTTLLYDPTLDAWDVGEGIPDAREHTSGFAHEGELWVVAGRRNSLDSNRTTVEIYDPAADRWRTGPPVPTARGGHGVAVLDGLAYAVGGEQPDRALDSVEALDLASGEWRSVEPLITPRHGHVVLAAAGRIWVIGGGDRPIFAAVDVLESFAP